MLAYVVVAYAARREWRDERFRNLYLAAEPVTGVRVKGKEAPLDAFLLQALP